MSWDIDSTGDPCFDCGTDGRVTLTVEDLADAASMRQVASEAHAELVRLITNRKDKK